MDENHPSPYAKKRGSVFMFSSEGKLGTENSKNNEIEETNLEHIPNFVDELG